MRRRPFAFVFASVILLGGVSRTHAAEPDDNPAPMVRAGLEWLVKQQAKDGHWEARSGTFPTALTGFAGMALLLEGSTTSEGRYSGNLQRARDWLISQAQPSGMLCDARKPAEVARYMHNHAVSMNFLASVYQQEEDQKVRDHLEKLLKAAVKFSGTAQTSKGGWGYVAGSEGGDFDEGFSTINQIMALRVAQKAGIPVPEKILEKADQYLRDSTTSKGGLVYSLAQGKPTPGMERPTVTTGAIACHFMAGDHKSIQVKQWLGFFRTYFPTSEKLSMQNEIDLYVTGQVLYALGEDGYKKRFPDLPEKDCPKWSDYRQMTLKRIRPLQKEDGSWPTGNIGPVFTASMYLIVLQLENGTVPAYQR